MHESRTGNAVTCNSSEALASYQDSIDRLLGSQSGAARALDEALDRDPNFALAQAARYLVSKDAKESDANSYRSRARDLTASATEWEARHVEVLIGLADSPSEHADRAQAHVDAYPGDLYVISQLAGYLFFHGGSNKRKAVLELLESVEHALGDDWAYLCRLGFAASEDGDRKRGRGLIERALESRPQALYAIHGLAHVLHDDDAASESSEILHDWLGVHEEDARGQMYGHVQWHLALAEWQLGKEEAAMERYKTYSAPETTTCGPILSLADCGGFLLRNHLKSGRSAPLGGDAIALIDSVWGMIHHPFVALHVAGLYATANDLSGIEKCQEAVEEATDGEGRSVSLALIAALRCFAREDYQACETILDTISDGRRVGIGGSNVERELIELVAQACVAN